MENEMVSSAMDNNMEITVAIRVWGSTFNLKP